MEAGPLGAGGTCSRCGHEFLNEARFCYHCGYSRTGYPRPLSLGRLFASLILAVLAMGLLSFGGCLVVGGFVDPRSMKGAMGPGLMIFLLGLLPTWGLVKGLR